MPSPPPTPVPLARSKTPPRTPAAAPPPRRSAAPQRNQAEPPTACSASALPHRLLKDQPLHPGRRPPLPVRHRIQLRHLSSPVKPRPGRKPCGEYRRSSTTPGNRVRSCLPGLIVNPGPSPSAPRRLLRQECPELTIVGTIGIRDSNARSSAFANSSPSTTSSPRRLYPAERHHRRQYPSSSSPPASAAPPTTASPPPRHRRGQPQPRPRHPLGRPCRTRPRRPSVAKPAECSGGPILDCRTG